VLNVHALRAPERSAAQQRNHHGDCNGARCDCCPAGRLKGACSAHRAFERCEIELDVEFGPRRERGFDELLDRAAGAVGTDQTRQSGHPAVIVSADGPARTLGQFSDSSEA
jgi:hypothetical protein